MANLKKAVIWPLFLLPLALLLCGRQKGEQNSARREGGKKYEQAINEAWNNDAAALHQAVISLQGDVKGWHHGWFHGPHWA